MAVTAEQLKISQDMIRIAQIQDIDDILMISMLQSAYILLQSAYNLFLSSTLAEDIVGEVKNFQTRCKILKHLTELLSKQKYGHVPAQLWCKSDIQ